MSRLPLSLLVLGFAASPAFAHKVIVTVKIDDNGLKIEAEYEGGEFVAAGAKVTVLSSSGDEVAKGETDEKGICVLPRPVSGVYTVTVDDKQGHFQKEVIVIRENESSEVRTTQRNRLLMATVGLAVIGGGTVIVRRRMRKID
jgi:hypothetical protein